MAEEHPDATVAHIQIATPEDRQAGSNTERVTERVGMIGGARLLHAIQCDPCGLIRVALQPQSPRKKGARHYLPGDLEVNDVPVIRSDRSIRSNISGGHAFEPRSGAWLIAQMMLSKHSLAKQLAERFGRAHGRCAESVGELQISERIAIVLNTLALKAADFLPLATAKGELLRLLRAWLAAPLIIALRPRAAPRRSSCDGIMACPGAFPSV
jgi:hypothetical protein